MKKGVALSINFVIIAIMAIAVILVVGILFNRGYLSGAQSISKTELRSRCMDLCLIDRYSQRTRIGEDSCYTNPPSLFSEKSYKVDEGDIHCYDIIDCYVDTEYGTCHFDENSGKKDSAVCVEFGSEDVERMKEIGFCNGGS